MATTAAGSGHSMGHKVEATYGTTPTSPAFTDIRHTGTSLGLSKSSFESDELRNDRQIQSFRHGNKSVAGDISIKMSYGSFDDLIEAALGGTWDTDVPSAGIDTLLAGTTRRSFTIERKFTDLDTPEWHRYTGCEINTFSLSVAPDAIVTGTFGVIGQDTSIGTAILSGATYPAATTVEPMDSFSGTITEGGSAIGTVTSIDFTLENGLNPLFAVGSDTTERPSIGKSRLTGTMTTYFQSKTLLEKFINETASSIILVLLDPAGNSFSIELPNVKYNGGQPDVDGEGEITISLPFIALYDAGEGSQVVIERNPV